MLAAVRGWGQGCEGRALSAVVWAVLLACCGVRAVGPTRPGRPPPGPVSVLAPVTPRWDGEAGERQWVVPGALLFVGPEGRIPLRFSGAVELQGETRGRLSRLRGQVVALDISGLPPSSAVALLRRHQATLQTVLWRGLRELTPVVLDALAQLASRELVLSLWPADAGAAPPDLRPLGRLRGRVTGLELGLELPPGGLGALGGLSRLRALYLRTSVGVEDVRALSQFPALRVLSLRNALVGHAVPARALGALAALPHLTWLDLSVNRLGDEALRWLRGCAALRGLDLGYNRLTGRSLPELGHLGNLGHLELGGNPLERAALAGLGRLSQLEMLGLAETPVADPALLPLGALGALRGLDLSGTLVGDAGLASLAPLARLRWLDLRRSRVTEPAAAALRLRRGRCEVLSGGAGWVAPAAGGQPNIDALGPCRRYLKVFRCMVQRMPGGARSAARSALQVALQSWARKLGQAGSEAARQAVRRACQQGLDSLGRLRQSPLLKGCFP